MITGLIRTIFIILAIYFLVRILGRLFAPFLSGSESKRTGNFQANDSSRPEGDVRVEYTNKNKSSKKESSSKEGDYIDFEEID